MAAMGKSGVHGANCIEPYFGVEALHSGCRETLLPSIAEIEACIVNATATTWLLAPAVGYCGSNARISAETQMFDGSAPGRQSPDIA